MRGLSMRGLRKYLMLAASGLLMAACATNPVTGEKQFNLMSEAQEIQIGQEMHPQVQREMGVYLSLIHISEPTRPY